MRRRNNYFISNRLSNAFTLVSNEKQIYLFSLDITINVKRLYIRRIKRIIKNNIKNITSLPITLLLSLLIYLLFVLADILFGYFIGLMKGEHIQEIGNKCCECLLGDGSL